MKISNKNLHNAKKVKNHEFYTQLTDIEKELMHYKEHFKNKVIYCNCDDPFESNFFKYFAANFNTFKLKKLIATCYVGSPIVGGQLPLFDIKGLNGEKEPFKLEINKVTDFNKDGAVDLSDIEWLLKNKKNTTTPLKQGGDFRSPECIEILKEADIVVTNPPFSLFREYVAQLIAYNKKFLIMGNQNAITYKEIFELIKKNKIWLGIDNGGTKWFEVPDHYDITTESRKKVENGKKFFSMGSIMWFTNLDNKKRHEDLILYKKYSKEEYPKYNDYNAINVNKFNDIPVDYKGSMGVPITFLDKYNPKQFKILRLIEGKYRVIDGKNIYQRLEIKNKKI